MSKAYSQAKLTEQGPDFYREEFEVYPSILPEKTAPMYSLFNRAIFSSEIPLGHSASQAPMFVQLPKPSVSICLIIFTALTLRSGSPCGNNARCDTLAETNSIAEVLGQAATHAPLRSSVLATRKIHEDPEELWSKVNC